MFVLETTRSVVDGCGITLACGAELLWVAFCCAAVHGAGKTEISALYFSVDGWQIHFFAGSSVVLAR